MFMGQAFRTYLCPNVLLGGKGGGGGGSLAGPWTYAFLFRRLLFLYPIAKKKWIDNPFWKEMLKYLGMFIQSNSNSFLAQPLWKNSKIQIDQKSIFFKKWNQKGIRFINDLVDRNGRIRSRNEFKNKISTSLDFLQYFSVCQVIKCTYITIKSVFKKVT